MFKTKKQFELSPRLRLGVGRATPQNQTLKYAAFFCLLLAVGLTANAIRLVFFNGPLVKTEASAAPQVLGATDIREQTNQVQFIEYKVKKGDTLFNVSQTFGINWTTLATLNNLKSPFTLKAGQVIKIPK